MSFFDIQVNGYAGVDFNQENLSLAELRLACEHLARSGFGGILATIITDSEERVVARLRRIVELRQQDELVHSMIAGLHVEGPFISPKNGYRGAHPADAVRPASRRLTTRLLEAAGHHLKLLTLAPEQDPDCEVIRMLVREGVTVAAGHTEATMGQMENAISAGLSMFTHFGNGCPGVLPRHDNILQNVLRLREHLWISLIADGVHIPFPALRNYLDLLLPEGKCLVTTDAMSAAGLGPGTYRCGRWNVDVGSDLVVRSPDRSHLIGSAMSMNRVVKNLSHHVGLDAQTIDLLVNVNPRRSLQSSALAPLDLPSDGTDTGPLVLADGDGAAASIRWNGEPPAAARR